MSSSTPLLTKAGFPASRLGLASQYLKDEAAVTTAFESGINYFFSYQLPEPSFLNGLKPLLGRERAALLLATGSEQREIQALRQSIDAARQRFNSDYIDGFFIEYVSPQDDWDTIQQILEEMQSWKERALIRYVGVSTHNREIATQLVQQGKCDLLMHRYNMAHRKAEATLLPAAQVTQIPVIAFTCTRWGTLLQGHPQWQSPPPTAAECYRYALHHPAVHLALMSPANQQQLQQNLSVLAEPKLSPAEIDHWRTYGDLIYGEGQDSFETQWL